jgi:hypothetical protein
VRERRRAQSILYARDFAGLSIQRADARWLGSRFRGNDNIFWKELSRLHVHPFAARDKH